MPTKQHFSGLPIGHKLLNHLVSEIFRINIPDKQTHRHQSTNNKGRLKLATHEPIMMYT